MSNAILGIVLAVSALIVGIGSGWLFKSLRPDNVIEEISEEIFLDQTGIDIDFTPYSIEKKESIILKDAKQDFIDIKDDIFDIKDDDFDAEENVNTEIDKGKHANKS